MKKVYLDVKMIGSNLFFFPQLSFQQECNFIEFNTAYSAFEGTL